MWREELFEAFLTRISFLFRMDCDLVFVQICLLSKCLVTPKDLAHEWPLTSVDPQVIEEIMKLSEVFIAVFVITFKNFHKSLSLRIFIFINGELSCSGHLVFYFG